MERIKRENKKIKKSGQKWVSLMYTEVLRIEIKKRNF